MHVKIKSSETLKYQTSRRYIDRDSPALYEKYPQTSLLTVKWGDIGVSMTNVLAYADVVVLLNIFEGRCNICQTYRTPQLLPVLKLITSYRCWPLADRSVFIVIIWWSVWYLVLSGTMMTVLYFNAVLAQRCNRYKPFFSCPSFLLIEHASFSIQANNRTVGLNVIFNIVSFH